MLIRSMIALSDICEVAMAMRMKTICLHCKPEKRPSFSEDNTVPDTRPWLRDNRSVLGKTESERAYYNAFRQRLKRARIALGYSQEQMAKALGMTKANYQKYEDRSKFPLSKIEALALVTHQSIDFVVTGAKPRRTPLRVVGE